MSARVVWVSGIDSLAQGQRLLDAGATRVTIEVVSDPTLFESACREWGEARVGLAFDRQSWFATRRVPSFTERLRAAPAFIEVDVRGMRVEDMEWSSLPSPLRLGGLWADHDEDPAWVESSFEEFSVTGATFVLNLLPSLREPFDYLRHEAGQHEEDLLLSDIQGLCDRFPIVLAADWSGESERRWFLEQIPDAHLSVYLGLDPDNGPHPSLISETAALAFLTELSARGLG